jgi:hypothetical protein
MSLLWCIEYSGLLYFWKICASLWVFVCNISSASYTICTLPHLGSRSLVRGNSVWWVKVTMTLNTAMLCIGHLKLFTTIHLPERLKVNYNMLHHGQSDNNNWLQHVLEKSCRVGHTACIYCLKNHNMLLRSLCLWPKIHYLLLPSFLSFSFPFIFYIIHPSSLCLFFHILLFIVFGWSLSFSDFTV